MSGPVELTPLDHLRIVIHCNFDLRTQKVIPKEPKRSHLSQPRYEFVQAVDFPKASQNSRKQPDGR